MITKYADKQTRVQHIHFVGIGGSGMAGIAEVLHTLGYTISGSDLNETQTTKRLTQLGINVIIGHRQENVANAQTIVVSSAISQQNVEVSAARKQGLPIVPRAEMLAELMRFRYGIAVSGTHGKTTVTSLIAHILSAARLDPTFIIGGVLKTTQRNAQLGYGDYLVAEADESDASFLQLKPMLSVITNIDNDHMQTYNNDLDQLDNAFIHFVSNLPFYGVCILCADNEGVKRILPNISRSIVRYGFHKQCDVQGVDIKQNETNSQLRVVDNIRQQTFNIKFNLIGKHNVLNTLAAISVCLELDVNADDIQQALSTFKGVGRRLERYDDVLINTKKVTLFDDYGHHPSEISAVLESLRQSYPKRRLILIFQAHRYSRTQALFNEFVDVLANADVLILTEIYSANEAVIAGISAEALAKSIDKHHKITPIVSNLNETINVLTKFVENDDVIIAMGAGSISHLAANIIQQQ